MRLLSIIGLILGLTSFGHAEGDIAAGKDFAQEWCSRCHNIDPGGPFKQQPPSFAAIAKYRSQDQIYSRIVIPPLHSSMPQLSYILTPQGIDDVVAYIVSLENQ